MKNKTFFNLSGLVMLIAMTISACSQDAEFFSEMQDSSKAEAPVAYTLHLDCAPPNFDGTVTRASAKWSNNSTIYLKLGDVYAKAVYNSTNDIWTIDNLSTTLATTSSQQKCTAYYFNGVSDPTALNEKTEIYFANGNYSHPNSTDIYVSANLSPYTWRLGFSGRSVTLNGNNSDLEYYSSFNPTNHTLTKAKMGSVSLSSGSYVYGVFAHPSGDNKIEVTTDNTYERTISGSKLSAKNSGILTAPTSSNYKTKGWKRSDGWDEIVKNCDVTPNYLVTFSDGMATDFTVGTNVAKSYMAVLTQQEANKSDEDVIKILESKSVQTRSEIDDYTFNYSGSQYSSNTTYYFCSFSYDNSGHHGNLVKYKYTTRSTTQPRVEISNVKYGTYSGSNAWFWTTTSYYSAYYYYMYVNESSSVNNYSEWYLAWRIHNMITTGTGGMTESGSNFSSFGEYHMSRTSNYINLVTWPGRNKNINGNYQAWQGHISSSRQNERPMVVIQENSFTETEKVLNDPSVVENGKIYLITP